jgi:hypothetical protein
VFDGRRIIPAPDVPVTLNVVFGIFGAVVLAVTVADPVPTPVTGTLAVVAPAANVTDDGTVATLALLDARLMVSPPVGAGPESVSVAFCVVAAVTESVAGVKDMVALTVTVCGLADVYPDAEALICADPTLSPVTVGCVVGCVAPWGTNAVALTDTTLGLVLLSEIVVPPAGAAESRMTV